ncbi:MAG TPA: metallophosphoesterase [Ktedonobacteraceae bacterium]|nr:metallophosphoesterase [Ktedonobacteraceae bacterium]
MSDDEIEKDAVHPGSDHTSSLDVYEDDIPDKRVNENENKNEEQEAGEVITIVFTADNHLGAAAFRQQPRKLQEREQRLRRAFQQATDFAIGQGVDLFIQAGDLFDTPTPDERDRSFVAERLAQLKQANIQVFALGGVHDTPAAADIALAPQLSYARLDALHYFAPVPSRRYEEGPQAAGQSGGAILLKEEQEGSLEPFFLTVRGILVGICGLGVLADQEGDPLAHVRVDSSIERAAIPLLVLHAPIEGETSGSSLLDARAQVSRSSIENLSAFRYILAGYHHHYAHRRIGKSELIIAGSTQHIDFSSAESGADHRDRDDLAPGFVFLGIARDGLRWCKHIEVDSLRLRRLVISAADLWTKPENEEEGALNPTERILEYLHPLCGPDTMVQVRLEGELTRQQYHRLDLNQIRRYGEEHCFALAIDDSSLSLLPDQEAVPLQQEARGGFERFSPRQELLSLVEEEIATVRDEQEKGALQVAKEEILIALDEVKGRR